MKITNVTLMEHLQQELDMCQLEFDGGSDSAFIIWNYTNLMEYLGGEAVVTFRQDMYKGTIAKFVNTLAKVSVIRTLERDNNVKLFTDVQDNHSTISFRDIAEGSTVSQVVVYVVDVSFDSTARASWCDFTVMDRERKIAQLRLFNPSTKDAEYKGRYIMCDIRRNKYGLSTDSIVTIDATFTHSPEVTVSEKYLTDTFADNPDILAVLQESAFTQFCKRHISEEPGYVLVRLALELDLANETANLVQGVNFKLVKEGLLFRHFTVLNTQSIYAENIVGFATVSKFRFPDKKDVLELLYSADERLKKERAVLNSIVELADKLVRVKKGLV